VCVMTVAYVVISQDNNELGGLETFLLREATTLSDEIDQSQGNLGGIMSGSESADSGSPMLARLDASNTVMSESFSLEMLPGWVVRGADDSTRMPDGTLWYGWLYNTAADEMTDPDVVQIQIKDALKEGRTFDEAVATLSWDAEDVTKIVAFMSAEAAEIFPDYSEADVNVDMEDTSVGGLTAKRNTLECLKPCYIEGAAQTNVIYFIDAPDRVYLLSVSVNTESDTTDLIDQADKVVRTFRLR